MMRRDLIVSRLRVAGTSARNALQKADRELAVTYYQDAERLLIDLRKWAKDDVLSAASEDERQALRTLELLRCELYPAKFQN